MVNNFKSNTDKRSFNVGIKLLITFYMFVGPLFFYTIILKKNNRYK